MKGFYFLLLLLLFSVSAWSQSPQVRECAAQILHNQQLENNPTYKSQYEKIQKRTREFAEQQRFSRAAATTTVREIPVYVHVIYDENNPEQNLINAQIESQIEVLNEDFRALNTDISGVPTEFQEVVADYQLIFTLEGITRKSSTVTEWPVNDEMKSSASGGVDAITPETHLNIWVCNLSGSTLGYAQFPGGAFETDGIVVGPGFFGSSDYDLENNFYLSANFDKGRTATHEIGHYLNLRHIWGDGGCSVDDGVADTPIAGSQNEGCPSYPSKSCEAENTEYTSDMFMNYMDYVNDACMFMFSEGQKTRSYALFEPGAFRENLGEVMDGCDLAAPTGLELVERSTTSLSLSWDEVANANSYEVWANGILSNSTTNKIKLTELEEGNIYEIKVRAVCAEGGTGTYSNSINENTIGCFTGPFELTLNTDNFGDETSWTLSLNGTAVQSDSTVYTDNTTYTENFDFGDGYYQFEIFDEFGDGICCGEGEGSYTLTDANGRIIKSGGEFEYSESINFCVDTPETIDCTTAVTAAEGTNTADSAPVLFEFEATEEREYIISSVGQTTVDTDLSIFNDCNSLLVENDDFEGAQSEIRLTLAAGQKIYILWKDTHSVAGFDWSINPGRETQTINFDNLPEKKADDAPFELSATATSGLDVSFTSSNENVATISGNTVTIRGVGQTTITAAQDGNEVYLAAPIVQRELTVVKADQTISITAIADKVITSPDFEIEAEASSGLALTYEITGPAFIAGSTITLDGTLGTVTVTANQAGNEDFNPASASVSFEVLEDICQEFSISDVMTTNISCFGEQNGQIEVSVSGGAAPYTYSLNSESQTETNIWEGLAAGEYAITVTDANDCSISTTATIKSPAAIEITAEVTNSNSIAGNGIVDLDVTGGSGSYSFEWSNGSSTSKIEDLPVGVYSVIVTDENGCSVEESFEVGGVTSKDKLKEDGFVIYPNPARNEFSLMHDGKSSRFRIYDAKGKIIKDESISTKELLISVSDWPSGLYFIHLNKEEKIQKFIKY